MGGSLGGREAGGGLGEVVLNAWVGATSSNEVDDRRTGSSANEEAGGRDNCEVIVAVGAVDKPTDSMMLTSGVPAFPNPLICVGGDGEAVCEA